jgi:hypothetical protein
MIPVWMKRPGDGKWVEVVLPEDNDIEVVPRTCFVIQHEDGTYEEISCLKSERHKYPMLTKEQLDAAYKPGAKWR